MNLNYTGAVIGPDLYWDSKAREIKVDRKNFFDNKVKKSSTEEEIKEFVLRAYGLLLTRGIYGNTYMCATRICESILPSISQRQGWQIEKALLSRQENDIQIDANTRPVKAAQPARLEWEADHKSGW